MVLYPSINQHKDNAMNNFISTIKNIHRSVQLEVTARQVCAVNEALKTIESAEVLARADALHAQREARSAKLAATKSLFGDLRRIWIG